MLRSLGLLELLHCTCGIGWQGGAGGGGGTTPVEVALVALNQESGFQRMGKWGVSCLEGSLPSLRCQGRLSHPWASCGHLFVPLIPQVGTNGIISTQDFPRETQYVDDDFPTDFPAIAPFLADIDTSGGRGRVLYRQDTSPGVLGLAASYVRTGFPLSGAHFTPTHAFLATWEQVGAYEEAKRGAPPSGEVSDHAARPCAWRSTRKAMWRT